MDYLGLAIDLSRTQAAGFIGYRCRDGMCGAEDCKTCRPNAEPALTTQDLREAAIADLDGDESLQRIGDCFDNNPYIYLKFMREIAMAHLGKQTTESLVRQLAERVVDDMERQS